MPARLPAALLAVLILAGCTTPPPGPGFDDGNGTNGGDPPRNITLAFDGNRALSFVEAQVRHENGTTRHRIPGTPGNDEAAALIADHMRETGWDVRYHHFTATYGCEETPMHNVVATLPGRTNRTLYLGAHYDSRPIAEKEADPEKRQQPIEGANDGGSGVAVLMELARALGTGPFERTLVMVFFDGEDGGGVEGQRCTEWILGSSSFAENLTAEEVANADGMILLDLVGDPELRLPWEGFSRNPPSSFPEGAKRSPRLQDRLWTLGGILGYPQFVNASGIHVQDDHLPFLKRGIPSVDIIHLRDAPDPFPKTHHRLSDTLENVSPASLEAVGRVVEYHVREWAAGAAS